MRRFVPAVATTCVAAMGNPPTVAQLTAEHARFDAAEAQNLAAVQAAAKQLGRDLVGQYANNYRQEWTDEEYVTRLYGLFLRSKPDKGYWSWLAQVEYNGRQPVLEAFLGLAAYQEQAGALYREIFWLVGDQLGTVRIIAERTGSLNGIKRHDYLPFGEELYAGTGGRTTGQGYVNDSVRQQFTSYERDDETGLDYAHARYFSASQGRFISVDPLLASGKTLSPQTWNRYTYVLNNPLNMTDPTGLFGDFYTVDGKRLGTDGQNDGRFYVVTDKSQAKAIEQTNKNGGTTAVGSVSSAVEIGSIAVRDAIGAAVTASNTPTTDDTKGGSHEEGLLFGKTANGSQIPVPAVPGAYSDVTVQGGTATVDPTHAANPTLAASLTSVEGTAHIHPSATGPTTTVNPPSTSPGMGTGTVFGGPPIKTTTPVFEQPASAVDKASFPIFAQQGFGNTHFVVGARSKQVEIYQVQNGASVLRATVKLDVFLRIGKKP